MSLYFVAIVPEEQIQREITAFKMYCQKHFGAGHALKTPPHITLIPPHNWSEQEVPSLLQVLESFAQQQTAFEVLLKNFASFPPRVIYVDVFLNAQLLQLHASLLQKMQTTLNFHDQRAQRFHPHMTIAHRDLTTEAYHRAWEHFSRQRYRRKFTVDKLVLFHHYDRKWHNKQEFRFG